MIKTYVLDTNILIQAPYAVHCFEDNQIVLPVAVLEELDNLKKSEGEKGANARTAIRLLEGLRQKGDLLSGVMLERGGSLRVEKNFVDIVLPPDLPDDKMESLQWNVPHFDVSNTSLQNMADSRYSPKYQT